MLCNYNVKNGFAGARARSVKPDIDRERKK